MGIDMLVLVGLIYFLRKPIARGFEYMSPSGKEVSELLKKALKLNKILEERVITLEKNSALKEKDSALETGSNENDNIWDQLTEEQKKIVSYLLKKGFLKSGNGELENQSIEKTTAIGLGDTGNSLNEGVSGEPNFGEIINSLNTALEGISGKINENIQRRESSAQEQFNGVKENNLLTAIEGNVPLRKSSLSANGFDFDRMSSPLNANMARSNSDRTAPNVVPRSSIRSGQSANRISALRAS